MAEIYAGGETFNVQIDGPADAPALILSNSLGTTLEMWDQQIPAFTRHFRVIRYDTRGHGKSTAKDGPYSIDQLGRDVLAIMDALNLRMVHWIGLSMGGMVGMWLLANARQRIGRAVLANTGAFMGSPDIWNTRIRSARNGDMDSIAAGSVDRWFTKEFQEKAPDTVKRIISMVRDTPPLGYASCCAAIRDMDQREAIRSITNEVLVIVGKHDPATPPAMGGLIAGSIPNARLIDLDAAHLSNIEAEMAFTRAVTAFLTAPEKSAAAPARKKAAKKSAAKKAPAKKASAKKASTKKASAKKAPAKKTVAKKSAAKKSAAKKTAAKKSGAKKAGTNKAPAKKLAAKKLAAKKSAAKKPVAKKSAAKKAAGKKARKARK